MSGEGLCWCASASKCPHGISARLPALWEDMEQVIDEVLQQFDRKTIKKFLKRDVDGNSKGTVADQMKSSIYKGEGYKESRKDSISTAATKKNRGLDSTTPSKPSILGNTTTPQRPLTDGGSYLPEVESSTSNNQDNSSQRPKTSGANNPNAPAFQRNLMSSSLPRLPTRYASPTTHLEGTASMQSSPAHANHKGFNNPSFTNGALPPAPIHAWGDERMESPVHNNRKSMLSTGNTNGINPTASSVLPIEIPGETTISVGLMRIADKLARLVLPWQAVLCPRAVETLFDLRKNIIQTRHVEFINNMKRKLEEKVMNFINKKEGEVEIWLENEITSWRTYMSQDETDLSEYIKSDLVRMSDRAAAQDQAYLHRELAIATALDDHERDSTREMLINFRRVCRAQHPGNDGSDSANPANLEVKLLQDSIAKAQNAMHKKIAVTNRATVKKMEEAHDWLCSLADNAVTARESENTLKMLYAGLDSEKSRGMQSLLTALTTYKEQHSAILEAITVFAGRIHQHASDYLQREQLVSRAFQQYLLSIVSGEIKTHTLDAKKSSYAWETKTIADRAHRKEQSLIADFHANINPLDKLTADFKERMRVQLDHITMKLQSVLNGRENDVNARKAKIHRKLAKHVNKACNARRQRLKDSTAVRRDEFELENKCATAVDTLSTGLRTAIDQIWVKEHLKERRIHEAASGRMERLEKSALIIWNKHAHLATDAHEEYEEWLNMYVKERDLRINERRQQIDRDYRAWRSAFGKDAHRTAYDLITPVKEFVQDGYVFPVDVPVEQNLADLKLYIDALLQNATSQVAALRANVSNYLSIEIANTDDFATSRKNALLLDWQENLYILNSAINRRVGSLKDMEADLEETIRMSILQHEVENGVFEQLSCARMENFWLDWRNQCSAMSGDMRDLQEDYNISKNAGKVKSRASRADRALDDLQLMAADHTPGIAPGHSSFNNPADLQNANSANSGNHTADATAPDTTTRIPSDTTRLKTILDSIRPEIYREFTHKVTRTLEKVRRDLGEGKRRLVPPYAITKALIESCDVFWEKARLSERCVGRVASKGVLLFADGLPTHARSLFCVSATMYVISELALKENSLYIDCDDVFVVLEEVKKVFIVGLLAITQQIGEFGAYFMRSECIWICSVFGIEPPGELLMALDAKGMNKEHLQHTKPTGFYSNDPVDLCNSVLTLTTELIEVKKLQKEYHEMILTQESQAQWADLAARERTVAAHDSASMQDQFDHPDDLSVSVAFTSDTPHYAAHDHMHGNNHSHTSGHFAHNNNMLNDVNSINTGSLTHDNIVHDYTNTTAKLNTMLQTHTPYIPTLNKFAYLVPSTDSAMIAAFLGRPDGSIELTPHRVCQVFTFWRRTALSIIECTYDPPSTEYPRIKDIITAHSAAVSGNKRTAYGNVHCISPFEAVSTSLDWVTSIKGLPISLNQALCILSRGGSCDPWLEDPKQIGRKHRIIYELREFLDCISADIPRAMNHNEFLQASLPRNIDQVIQKLDLNFAGQIPLEVLRTYIQREDPELTNTQISLIYWSLCRVNEELKDDMTLHGGSVNQSLSAAPSEYNTFQTGGVYRPIVATEFHGDPIAYMHQFSQDVDKYLNSMPTIDTNVILGYLPGVLAPTSAHELVSDAMKLDVSAKNVVPASCCVWTGARQLTLPDALSAITTNLQPSRDNNLLLTVGSHSFHSRAVPQEQKFNANTRIYVEVDLLSKYPELCNVMMSNKHYGPAGNEPILSHQGDKHDDHWQELMNRRLNRMDKLTIAWRDIMMNEWSTSLYQSRTSRYLSRVDVVKKCVGVYHAQYSKLKEGIVSERQSLMSRFSSIEAELLSLIQEDYNYFSFHTSFLERALRRYEGQMYRCIVVIGDVMTEFQRHTGSIKRRGIERIANASVQLRKDLEVSCSGLIMGYTAGYAQGYFDELVYRGEVWRSTLTDLQGRLILEKEKFASAKDEIDRDLTIQVSDKLTLDRNSYKGHLETLQQDTAMMLDRISTTRAAYASVQKDANARLIVRIEKAVRESRKLRVAAEQQAELEGPAMRDIRVVLDTARNSCMDIVAQIKESCLKQLFVIEPLRAPHRAKMENRVLALQNSWKKVEDILLPLVEDYRREVYKHLALTKSQCMNIIGKYRENESFELKERYKSERAGLILAFRTHFREYDLSEAAIFERFNKEVLDTVGEMNTLWGPSRPKFITQGLSELDHIVQESITSGYSDVCSNMYALNTTNDDYTMSRMEICDLFTHSLSKSVDHARTLPVAYINEKKNQLVMIDEMSMEKNGDMVRPQVKAVLDLLLSGIEIDSDFGKGYDSLVTATAIKSGECHNELIEFNDRYANAMNPLSIDYSASLTLGRIDQRRQEVNSLIDASHAHLVADHSRLDVLLNAGAKDIEEWATLTLALIENAFHNAETTYLSNLWPTPPTTPRLELISEDEDRVGKLKALLAATHAGNVNNTALQIMDSTRPYDHTMSTGLQSTLNNTSLYDPTLQHLNDTTTESMALAILGGVLEDDDDVQESVRATRRDARRAEKAARKAEKERLLAEQALLDKGKVPPRLKQEETRELQQGWFECVTPEGYTYYFNPETQESLWQLPQFLLTPLLQDDVNSQMETPREFLMLENTNMDVPETIPIRVVPAEYTLKVVLDPAVLLTQVAEEARAAVSIAVDTAIDVTSVIRGKRGKDEKTISSLLGDRFNPNMLKKTQPYDSISERSDSRMLPSKMGFVEDPAVSVDGSAVELDSHGRVIDTQSMHNVDPEMQEMLLSLGLGTNPSEQGDQGIHNTLPSMQQSLEEASEFVLPTNTTAWLNLGLGGSSTLHPANEDIDSGSDGEDYTHYKDEAVKRRAEQKYHESREIDLMTAEDQLSIMVENFEENQTCNNFMQLFQQIVETSTAYEKDKETLQALAKIIKPINVIDIMATLKTSWKALDSIILETLARDEARKQLEFTIRTKEGLERQNVILEHSEDIEEVADFLHIAGLSKSTAKRVATELILKNISTPKKLAKIWSRGEILLTDFKIDADDMEEVESALRQLLMSASTASMYDTSNANASGLLYNNNASYASPFESAYLQNSQSLQLDANYVTEVADAQDYDSAEEEDKFAPNASKQKTLARTASTKAFTFTKEGYKSFVGGWVECFTEDGNKYYYNTANGESSWQIPGAKEEDEEVCVEDHREEVEEHNLPPQTSYEVIVPTNTFAHSYDELSYPPNHNNNPSLTSPSAADPHNSYAAVVYDPNNTYTDDQGHAYYYDEAGVAQYYPTDYSQYEQQVQPYYDENGQPYYADPNYNYNDGNYNGYDEGNYSQALVPAEPWSVHDALKDHAPVDPSEYRRDLPVPPKAEVIVYSKKEGVSRQMALLSAQDRWQNALVKTQHYITEQKSQYLQLRVEMFERVSQRVETRLAAFVEDIKVMQKSLKQDLGDSMSTERDLRRLFEQKDSQSVVAAEKLSFVLESLEKFKVVASERYESSFAQIDKFGVEWELLKTELTQVGDIYDEGVAANLEQCRMACEHNAKLYAYDQLKIATKTKQVELRAMRNAVHRQLRSDTHEAQKARFGLFNDHAAYNAARNVKKDQLTRELSGWNNAIEDELRDAGFPAIEPEHLCVPEEEFVMSYMLTQIEMELSLKNDYDSITEATKNMVMELQAGIKDFDETEKRGVIEDGSWYNKHRETLERHEQALHTTLNKVRSRMNEGYQLLHSKLEALDFEVERAAEEELFQGESQAESLDD